MPILLALAFVWYLHGNSTLALGETSSDPTQHSSEETVQTDDSALDTDNDGDESVLETLNFEGSHYALSMALGDTAKRLDNFFGDDRADEEIATSQMRIGAGFEYRDGDGIRLRQRVRLSLDIPKTSERLKLLVEGDNEEIENRSNRAVEDDGESVSSALRFIITKSKNTSINLDGGLRLRPAPDPFVRLRWRRNIPVSNWILRPAQFVFWRREIGFGETSRVDLEYAFEEDTFFRATAEATWSEDSEGVDLSPRLQQYIGLNPTDIILFETGANAHTHPSSVVDEYFARLRYRSLVYRKWFFIEVTPGLRFERERSYTIAPFIGVLFEVLLSPDVVDIWAKPKNVDPNDRDELR